MEPALGIDDRVVVLHEGVTRIGRSITADIELEDITVSRRHALIVREDRDYVEALVRGEDPPLPLARRTKTQREIHARNLKQR